MERLPTPHRSLPIGLAVILLVGATAAQVPPLIIARQGYFFVGGKYLEAQDGRFMSGQIAAVAERWLRESVERRN